MTSRLRRIIVGIAIAAGTLAALPAIAEVIALKAELRGANEVPPNKAKGSGALALTYDRAARQLTWKGSYSGLSGPVTAAHFHGPAVAGRNAGIALVITSGALPAAFEGSATLTEAQAADLLAGRWYVNLHTAANPAGEIRGQVLK